jgi:RnfABCDGE-type electron transport complex E subunit/RnfABCDGE-type electron transport complex A subunit
VTDQREPSEYYQEFVKGIWKENPVFVMVLGMCPMLAVTNTAMNAVAMAAATTFVLMGSSLLVSLLRKLIPKQVRISTYIIIIATFVTVADFTLEAYAPLRHRELGAFISLIVVNCLILGRQEAFASRHRTLVALADAAGMSIGFAFALLCLGATREILGFGTLFEYSLFGDNFEPWVIMVLPPGGFLMLGFIPDAGVHPAVLQLAPAAGIGSAPAGAEGGGVMDDALWIFISAMVINNFTLYYFLGLCPFFGVSGQITTAFRLGLATIFVMLITSLCASFLNAYVLPHAPYLKLIAFILVIASTVQFVEMVIRKISMALFRALGIFLPLITTNCAILFLALTQTSKDYTMVQGIIFALGAGGGFTLALVLMAGLREQASLATMPQIAKGTAMNMIIAGLLSLAFMGFAGLFSA